MSRVLVTRRIDPAALQQIADAHELILWREDRPIPREALLELAADAEGILTMLTDKIDAELLAAAPKLRVVSQMAVGYDNIDVAACAARGIPVGHTPGVLTESSADLGAEERPLDDLLRESDFISLHAPYSPATHHLISTPQFALMKPTAVLINTARGGVVDPSALYVALSEKRIFAAALDVTEPEPINMDSPLLMLENCLIVPHIASASVRTRQAMADLAARNLLAGLRGDTMPHAVKR